MDAAVPAIVTAGDGRAAKAIYGESKVYLELGGRSLVAHIVAVLQRVPEVSEVWVVGDAARLEAVLGAPSLRAELAKPLHVVPQFRNLFENCWETYRRLLPDAPVDGRDPVSDADLDQRALFLSADLPFATPQEISEFVRRGLELDVDYVLGLTTEAAMEDFYPTPDRDGIRMAYFNLREGRFRQNNLHLVRPGRLGNRHYIEEMYELRYQKQFRNMLSLAWTLLRSEQGGFAVLGYYLLLQAASIANRKGWHRLANAFRRALPITRIEIGCSKLLDTRYRFAITDVGGCAVDVDNEHDFDVSRARYDEWHAAQTAKAERMYGALPARAGPDAAGGSTA